MSPASVGFTPLAARFGVTQPALTRSLQLLESAFSTSLFERTASGVKPTEAGDIVRRHAQHIVNSARYVKMEIDAITSGQSGELRIGCGMIWSSTRMPALLAQLHGEFPLLDITVQTGISAHLMPRLFNGTLDVVMARIPTEPLPAGFSSVDLGATKMVVLARKDHPLQRKKQVQLADLCNCNFLGYALDNEYLTRWTTLFGAHRLQAPHVILKANSIEVLLATALVSDSLIVLSDIELELAKNYGLRPLRLDTPLWSIQTGVCYRTPIGEMAPLKALVRNLKAPSDSPPKRGK
jgi:DNA-binding transcriptional LysR family regulator